MLLYIQVCALLSFKIYYFLDQIYTFWLDFCLKLALFFGIHLPSLFFSTLRPCSFRGYINPTHTHPLSPTPSPLFPLLPTLKQKISLLPTLTHSFPPFPTLLHSTPLFIQLIPTFTHSFPHFLHLKKNTTLTNSHPLLSPLSHTHPSHTPNFPLKRTGPNKGKEL